MKDITFLAIGDIVIDAFIKLQDAEVHTDLKKDERLLCLKFADKIPYRDVYEIPAVGNSPNAAVAAARLGCKSFLATDIGKDSNGKICLKQLKTSGVKDSYVRAHKNQKTNYHYVLWYNEERTILVKHEQYPYLLPKIKKTPDIIYLSSLADNSYEYHMQIAEYLDQNPDILLAFQPGTFQMKMGRDKLARLYRRSNMFFCNKEEAERILGKPAGTNIKELLSDMNTFGPKIVFITDGPAGAYARDIDGSMWHIGMYPDPRSPVDRTGAGDAFSSTCAVALAQDITLKDALMWGPINSMSVVQKVGAQAGLLTHKEITTYLAEAPESYKVKEI